MQDLHPVAFLIGQILGWIVVGFVFVGLYIKAKVRLF
jgi:uncharacterized membrane protein YciS (DUF1049 family)